MTAAHETDDHAQARADLEALLADCVRRDASDLHLSPNLPPYFRVHGLLAAAEKREAIPTALIEEFVRILVAVSAAPALHVTGSVDG
ncbi:MAG: twitching motility protein, partial [Planctomycetes bacterium]|nr:twitching motility protein [Planctomycetota bacterium]